MIIDLIVGAVVGFIVGWLVFHNNTAKANAIVTTVEADAKKV